MSKEAHTTKPRGMARIVRIHTTSTNTVFFLPKVLADNPSLYLTTL